MTNVRFLVGGTARIINKAAALKAWRLMVVRTRNQDAQIAAMTTNLYFDSDHSDSLLYLNVYDLKTTADHIPDKTISFKMYTPGYVGDGSQQI